MVTHLHLCTLAADQYILSYSLTSQNKGGTFSGDHSKHEEGWCSNLERTKNEVALAGVAQWFEG